MPHMPISVLLMVGHFSLEITALTVALTDQPHRAVRICLCVRVKVD